MHVNIGDIILAKYLDFNGTVEDGLFLVYSKDNYWLSKMRSFSALKVCTNPLSYQVPISKKQYPFLDHDSYINCSCQQRFKEVDPENVTEFTKISKLGSVNSYTLDKVRKQLRNFNKDVDEQLQTAIEQYNSIAKNVYNSIR